MLKKLCIYIPSILVLLFVLEWQYARKYLFYEKKTMLPLEVALQAAGGNKKELQKVLHYYKKNPIDSLKYKAACFLIENMYNPQIQISAESETKRSIFREKDKTKRSKKESAQHSKSRNKSFVMTSVSAL